MLGRGQPLQALLSTSAHGTQKPGEAKFCNLDLSKAAVAVVFAKLQEWVHGKFTGRAQGGSSEGGAGLEEQRWDPHVPEAAFCNFRGFKVTQFYGAAF